MTQSRKTREINSEFIPRISPTGVKIVVLTNRPTRNPDLVKEKLEGIEMYWSVTESESLLVASG